MKSAALSVGLLLLLAGIAAGADEARLLTKVTPLPIALSDDFEFRKTKLYHLTPSGGLPKAARVSVGLVPGRGSTSQDTSISFERQYRLFGAVTALDQRERFGNYFDFFWKARRATDLTVRLEYRQQKLHALVQGQEIFYPNARGHHKTAFKVVGDDYLDDGAVTAWRCVLIENGQVVAETRSYMWQ